MKVIGTLPNSDRRTLTVYADESRMAISITDPTLGAMGYEMPVGEVTTAQAQRMLDMIREAMQSLWSSVH